MGLLDDAIREHLELKRLRGADPGEVAREQREALDPIPGEHAARDHDPGAAAVLAPEATGGTIPLDPTPAGDHPPEAPQPASSPDVSNVGEETAELDMRTVMDEHEGASAYNILPTSPVASSPGRDPSSGERPEEESLEWEVPGGSTRQPATDRGDQEHALGEHTNIIDKNPDFLPDTPEQEGLSFEQRPPRDFDK